MRAYDITAKIQDLRHLDWAERSQTSGTSGMFLKAREGQGTSATYYKLSCYDSYRGIFGHECVNELVAARLMGLLGIEHVRYQLVHALVCVDGREYETRLARSRSYRHSTERKQALDVFYRLRRLADERPLDFCDRMGWSLQIRRMMLADYLIANRDRHGANIEVLCGSDGVCRLAPLFDNGLSFVFSCYGDQGRIARFDVMDDMVANNFVGTKSLEENLAFLQGFELGVNPFDESWEVPLFQGLEGVISEVHRDAMWRMIKERWQRYALLSDNR